MPTVRALSKLHLKSSVIFESDLTEFPETPTSGETVLKDGILWIYSLIEGVQTWYPLTNYRDSFVHTQALENLTWTVNHGFGTPDVIFIVYDANGSHVVPGRETIDSNSFRLTFTSATAGRVIVFADSERFMPSIQTESISTDTVVLGGASIATSQFAVGDSSFTSVAVEGRNLAVLDEDNILPAAVIPETFSVRTLNFAPALAMTTVSVDKGGAEPVEVAAINDQPVALLDKTNLKLLPEQIPESIEINDLTADEVVVRTLDATETVAAPTGKFNTSLTVGGKAVATQEGLQDAVDTAISALVDAAPNALNTLNELASALGNDPSFASTMTTTLGTKASKTEVSNAVTALEVSIATKVDKVTGKGLSTNDFTGALKTKLDGVEANANNFSLPAGVNGQVLKMVSGAWAAAADDNTTYAAMSEAEANAGTATTGRVITPAILKTAINTHAAALLESTDIDGGEF